ncbi:LYAG-like protein, partial [Mya arenaria]
MAKVTFSGVIIFILLMTIALFGLNAIVGKDFRYMSETSHSTSDRREQLGESLNAHMIVVETKRFFFENVFRVGQEENYRKISSFQLTDVLIEDGKHQLKSSSKVKIETDRLATKSCSIPNPAQRFDCHPEVNGTREICEMRGCCWQETKLRVKPLIAINYTDTQTPVDIPFCFYPLDFPGYTVAAVKETDLGVSLDLHTDHQFYYPRTVMNLRVDVMLETDARLHVKIYDADNSRYEVPLPVPKVSKAAASTRYMVTTSGKDEPFTITLVQVVNTCIQFLQLSSVLPSSYMMGLGEHRMDLMQNLNWTRHTMWNIDQYPREDVDMYGSHPFYLVMEEGGRASGFFLLNSNAMDNPADVIFEYTKVIGRTFMPPYWGLGFHVCRFGYKNVSDTLRVTNRIRQLGIPQDVQWNDIDYAIGRRDFTTDKKIFGDQPAMVEELHSRGMRYIIITDPGIDPSQPPGTYPPFDVGKEMDIFMRNHTGQLFVGKVWTDETVWVDYSHPRADKYWTQMVTDFHKKVPIDGLWIDMNEVSNFVDGSRLNSPGCPNTTYDHPPFVPAVRGGYLYKKTSCPSCRQYISRNYDVHNLYGLMETNLTNRALRAARSGKRAFVISRSTFAGQGHFGGHWTGDNIGTFHDMYRSISVILRMGMFGIPMVGADICGFQGNATYEMCLRFYQLGAFYPFSRTHNDFKSNDQDPGAFDRHFADIVREAYLIRYSMLPLLYTLFYNSHITGAPVARAMFY